MTDTINVPRELLEKLCEMGQDAIQRMGSYLAEKYNEQQYIDAAHALLKAPAQPAQVQGWKMVKVNEAFSDLVNALERADRKGYLAEALIESWEAFDYEYADAAAPKPGDDVARDAARYRWLRDRMRVRKMQAMDVSARPALVMRVGFGFLDVTTDPYSGWLDIRSFDEQREKLDAAIDAAMESKGNDN